MSSVLSLYSADIFMGIFSSGTMNDQEYKQIVHRNLMLAPAFLILPCCSAYMVNPWTRLTWQWKRASKLMQYISFTGGLFYKLSF